MINVKQLWEFEKTQTATQNLRLVVFLLSNISGFPDFDDARNQGFKRNYNQEKSFVTYKLPKQSACKVSIHYT